jgi:hypothetical protein
MNKLMVGSIYPEHLLLILLSRTINFIAQKLLKVALCALVSEKVAST